MSATLFILLAHPAQILALDVDTGECRTVLAPDDGSPDGVQVDASNGVIYWTSMGAWPDHGEDFLNPDGTIESCLVDGTGRSTLVGGGTIVTPKQLQFDAKGKHLYWCDREGMAIYRSSLDGSNLKTLLRTGVWPEDQPDVLRHCVGIALDPAEDMLYWTQKGPPDGGQGRIFRMGLELPDGQTPDDRSDVVLLMDGLPEPIDLEIDEDRGQIYWTDRGDPSANGNSVNRADITPEGLRNQVVLATGLKEAIGLALDLKNRRAFVGDLSGAIRMLPMDGGEMTTIYQCAGLTTGLAFVDKAL
jgi:hypothetical protein